MAGHDSDPGENSPCNMEFGLNPKRRDSRQRAPTLRSPLKSRPRRPPVWHAVRRRRVYRDRNRALVPNFGILEGCMKKTLWVIQILLALLFLFAGGAKFFMPVDQMAKGMPAALATGSFIHFIGVCEVLGGLGLVLPGLLRIKPGLTPLAAAGLAIIMIGATALSVPQGVAMAAFPLLTGILAVFVAYGRWRVVPL